MRSFLALAFVALLVPSRADASRITTQNGSVITGDVVSLQNGVYTVRTPYGTITIPAASVTGIEADAAPAPAAPPAGPPLRLAGSTTLGDELAPALLEAFAASLGATNVTQTPGATPAEVTIAGRGPQPFDAHLSRLGSGTAFTALQARTADVGMASRRITPAEAASLAAAGLGDFTQPGLENVAALDGLIIVVNRANTVNTLSIAQLRDLFTGRITDWSQVGGQAGPVHLYGRDSKSGTADTFGALVLAGAHAAPSLTVATGSDDLTAKVLADPAGIGYTGFAYLGGNKALNVGTECGLEFAPIELLVRTEEYPLSRRLYLYAPLAPASPRARPFIDFALGDQGQSLVRNKGFVDLVPQLAPQESASNRIAIDLANLAADRGATREDAASLQDFARRAVNGARVSTTFRFQTGSAALDSRAARDVDRLAGFLKTAAAGRHVLIAGFADSVGSSASNRALSLGRARAIAALLQARGVPTTEVTGFGRIAPVACNTDADGREKNRRVEVWVF